MHGGGHFTGRHGEVVALKCGKFSIFVGIR